MLAEYNGTTGPLEQYTVAASQVVKQGVSLKNIGTKADSYNISIGGIPADWLAVDVYGLNGVNPGEGRCGEVIIMPRQAGTYTITITVTSVADGTAFSVQAYTLHVA